MNDNEILAKKIKGATIRLYTGTYFDYLDPDSSEYTVLDIAHALSNQCRFAGHTHFHYSVAQHCVLASHIVAPEFAYEALMHDAPEFVVTDLVKPLKNILPDFQAVERRVEESVGRRFGFTVPMPEAVKIADLQMLKAEQHQVMNAGDDDWMLGVEAAPVRIHEWPPAYAKHAFLERFFELDGIKRLAAAA